MSADADAELGRHRRRGAPSRSSSYHRSVRLVSRWAALYTRDLPPAVAADRRDELASDLWEQGSHADARGGSATVTSASILWRAARGIPSDLYWRRGQTRPERSPDRLARLAVSGTLAITCAAVLATIAVGAAAVARIGFAITRGEFLPSSLTLASLAIGLTAMTCGIVLLRRPRTRSLAALWLASASAVVLHFGAIALITLSTTAQSFADPLHPDRFRGDPLLSIVGIVGLTLFYLILAIAWLPARRRPLATLSLAAPSHTTPTQEVSR